MHDNRKDIEKNRRLFASAMTFRDGAEILLSHGNEYVCVAAALCHQSAIRMMVAFIQIKDKTINLTAELESSGIWEICMMLREEMDDVDEEVQTLLDCEWVTYPPEPGQKEPDAEYAKKAVHCVRRLEQAILKAVPKLAAHG